MKSVYAIPQKIKSLPEMPEGGSDDSKCLYKLADMMDEEYYSGNGNSRVMPWEEYRKYEEIIKRCMGGHETLKKYLAWIPVLFIAVAIFCFSGQPADQSSELSDMVTRLLPALAGRLHLLELSPETVYEWCVKLSTPVRKCAHITEFTLLYVSLLYALYQWGVRGRCWLKYAFCLTVLYACSDEFHQLFVPGRAGMITDVLIDSIGAAVITALLWIKISGCVFRKSVIY